MGISDRLLGKKNVNGKPHIEGVSPAAALPGGEIRITGSGLRPRVAQAISEFRGNGLLFDPAQISERL